VPAQSPERSSRVARELEGLGGGTAWGQLTEGKEPQKASLNSAKKKGHWGEPRRKTNTVRKRRLSGNHGY